ncbi:MAG: hypothetical protein IPL98_14845 [Saprospiraceae bacterium]|nr:hypothetical protein [Saprospiraceae bacterium]
MRILKVGGEPLGSSQMELGSKLETNASTLNLEAKASWPTKKGRPRGPAPDQRFFFG